MAAAASPASCWPARHHAAPRPADRIRRDLEGRVGRQRRGARLSWRGCAQGPDRGRPELLDPSLRPLASSFASGWRSAAYESRHPALLQRARRRTPPSALAALIVLAITALNVVPVVTLSRHSTELSSQIDAERAEVDRLTAEATRIRGTDQQGRTRADRRGGAGGERADRSAHVFVDGVLQPDRGDDAA